MDNAASWQRLDDLFHQAWDLAPEEREAFLDRACGDDLALRRELEALLAAAATPSDWIDGSASEEALDLLSADARFPHGTLIGRYRVLRLLGRGGMGSVYLAERSDGHYDQKVALKVIKRGMDTDALLDRFRRERQILAELDHPGIARLIDGGATRDGRPYLVMEHIAGEPIDRFVARHDLGLDQRLDLFLEICDAVSYSHRRLVIHRDLKPSNILVTADGSPKLLDFGTAKMLAEVEASHTSPELRLVTPGYASPEQLAGGPITTASDVHGLGILLYELLSDRNPFGGDGGSPEASAAPDRRAGQPRHPPRPSQIAPRQRRARLRGDLDAIVACALRHEPEARYESVAALMEDLERHRQSRPVRARQGNLRYRGRRFLRRHRYGVAAAAVVLALTVALISALFLGERKARREQARAEAMTDYLKSMFEGFDRFRGEAQPVTAREMLDRGVARLDTELRGEPAKAVEVLSVLAEIYGSLGHFTDAENALERGLALARGADGLDPLIRHRLRVELAEVQTQDGNLEAAAENLHDVLATLPSGRRATGPASRATADLAARARLRLGTVERLRGRNEESVRHLSAALQGLRGGADAELLDEALLELGRTRVLEGRLDTARELIEEAIERRQRRYGEHHPKTILALEALGTLEFDSSHLAAAQAIMHRVLEAHVAVHGPDHPVVLRSLYNLGALEARLGRYASAAERFGQAIARMRSPAGHDHPQLAPALMWSARIALDRGEIDRARRDIQEARELIAGIFPDDHAIVRDCLNLAGNVERAAGDFDSARRLLGQALGEAPQSATAQFSRLYLAEAALEAGETDAATHWLLRIRQEALPTDARYRHHLRLAEAALALRRGDLTAAEGLLTDVDRQTLADLSLPDRLAQLELEAALDLARGQPAAAELRALEVLEEARHGLGPKSPSTGRGHLLLALARRDQGRAASALHHLEAAVAILPAGADHPPQGGPSARRLRAQITAGGESS